MPRPILLAVALFVCVVARAAEPDPLLAGETRTIPITADFVVIEIGGAPVRVIATLTATTSNRVTDRQWDLPAFGQRTIRMTNVLHSLGPMEATLNVSGDGRVIVVPVVASDRPQPPTRHLPASFKAAPFRDPATGLVLMRERWYDPSTGSFLTPDPLGHRDSSNLYNFCGGDPVNCSDPTGRAAAVNRKGDIIGIRPDGSRYFVSAAEGRADPVNALRVLESDRDLGFDEQEDLMTRAGLPIPISSACRANENCLSRKRTNDNAFTHLPRDGKWGEAVFIATTGLPPQTREQQIVSGGVQIASAVIPTAAAVRARARRGVGPGVQPVFDTRAGVPLGVNSHMERVAQFVPTVTVYRVEGPANARVTIEPNGEVRISDGDAMLFLNFGDPIRAQHFFAQRLRQKMFGVTTKSFDVPSWFLYQLRAEALMERGSRRYAGASLVVDESKASDQYGLRPERVDKLRRVIVPGTGREQ